MPALTPAEKTPRLFVAAWFLLSALGVALYLSSPSFLTSVNGSVTDLVMAGAEKRPPSGAVVVIDLDDESLAKYGQWPWPRSRLAELLQRAKEQGAKSIALDMILAEPERNSPGDMPGTAQPEAASVGPGTPRTGEGSDRRLAEALGQGPFVLGYTFLFSPGPGDGGQWLHPLPAVHLQARGDANLTADFFEAKGLVGNLEMFAKAAPASGFLNASPDVDGLLRRLPLVIGYRGELFPSLALAAFMQFAGEANVQFISGTTGSRSLQVGDRRIPIDNRANLLLDFRAQAEALRRVSAADLLDGRLPPDALLGKVAVLGSSASGLDHAYQTPGDPVFSHVGIHTQALETLLSGSFVVRDGRFVLWEGGASLLLAMLFGLLIARAGVLVSGISGGMILCGLWFGARLIFAASGYLLSPLLPISLTIVLYAVLTIVKTRKGEHQAQESADNALMLLRHSENDLNSIISSIPDIIFRLDQSGRIIFVSPAITQYKSQAGDLLGQPIFDLVAPEDRGKSICRINERRTGKRATQDLELRLLLDKGQADGAKEERYFSVSAQGLYRNEGADNGTFLGTQGIARDITEQKKLKDRLSQAQKMEAVGHLAAGVAHDLNNVLTGLVSYPDLLLLQLPPDSPLREQVAVIKQSGQKAAAIVQDMVTLARRGVANREVFAVNRIVQEYFASLEFGKLRDRHPQIEFESILDPDLLNVRGYPLHLSKALMNLVTNAAEAMPAGGRILVSSGGCYLDTARHGAYDEIPEGEYVCLSVEDDGIGISAADRPRIFEPFFSKKKMGGSGTGLGMMVVWATVKDQDGFIDLHSKEGEGTRFDIYLPTTRDAADGHCQRLVLEDYLGTERILVVDDVSEQRDIATNMLTKLGYKVVSAASGETAVKLLKDTPVDLVVLDMIMPNGMDGLDTYRQIIALFPGQKAIIASGFSESERVRELQSLGGGEYLQQPYTLEKIGVAVRQELDRK